MSLPYIFGIFLCLVVCSSFVASREFRLNQTWCIAQGAAADNKLRAFLNKCCSQFNCGYIQPGGPCYEPNTLHNHASYALDLWFRNKGECPADIGTPAITDPSFGGCHYP